MKNDNPRGSIWRKWDLHIHSKFSGEDRASLEIVDIFKNAIENKVDVISITDHSNFDCLDDIWEVWENSEVIVGGENKKVSNFINFLPGIELKGNIGKRGVHFLAIFPKNKDNEKYDKKHLETFLAKINCAKTDIKQISSDSKKGLLDVSVDFKKTSSMVRKWGGFVIVHNGSKDHSFDREISHASMNADDYELLNTLGQEKELLMKDFIDICELPNFNKNNKKEADFYISNFKKPCVVFSDSHKNYPENSNFTWIKADPTFEGLRQIIYEPNERVRIQENNPNDDFVKYVIDGLKIKSSKTDLLVPQKILFNRNLSCIIGGKGTGKSTLLSLVAGASEDYEPHPLFHKKETFVDFCFVNKDIKNNNFEIDVSEDDIGEVLPILYIKQEELAQKISNKNNVRKSYLDEIGIPDISINYNGISIKINNLLGQIGNQKNIVENLKIKTNYNNIQKISFDVYLDNNIKKQKAIIKLTSTKNTKEIINSITKTIQKGKNLREWIKDNSFLNIKNDIIELNKNISVFNKKLEEIGLEKNISEVDLNITIEDFDKIKNLVDIELQKERSKYREESGVLRTQIGAKEDVSILLKNIENAQSQLGLFEDVKKNFEDTKQYIKKTRDEISSLFNGENEEGILNGIENTKDVVTKQYKDFCEKRRDSNIFNILFEGVSVRAEVFFNFKKLEEDINSCFLKGELESFDKKVFGEGEKTYYNYCKWVADDFWKFYDSFKENSFRKRVGGEDDGRSKILEIIFSSWFDYIEVSVAINNSFKGKEKEIEKMSTGELATVLLKLKLVTEGLDKQIILLDQPEDHLDNDFIANDLVDLIKELKKERQVVIATHNANLVVGADAEQVIVANFDESDNKYFSGSLENMNIQNKIIKILEGGEDAFDKRRKRYNIKNEI